MSEIVDYEINGSFIQLPEFDYQTIAEFRPPIHEVPITNEKYHNLISLIKTAPELLENIVDTQKQLQSMRYALDEEEIGLEEVLSWLYQLDEQQKELIKKAKGELDE